MVQDIIEGLTNFIGSFGASILDFVLSLLATLLNIIIIPLDSLFTLIFPNFSEALVNFNNGIAILATAPIGFFVYHIPPMTKLVLLIYISFMLGYYSIIWTYRAIIIFPTVIRKIKFW